MEKIVLAVEQIYDKNLETPREEAKLLKKMLEEIRKHDKIKKKLFSKSQLVSTREKFGVTQKL